MENNDNKYLIFFGIFVALCAAVAFGVWYSLLLLGEAREEYDMLSSERANFSSTMEALRAKNRALKKINELSFNQSEKASDSVEFYMSVRRAIDDNKMNMLSMSSSQESNSENPNSTLTIKIKGEYYSLAHLFADWRKMPFASRIKSLKIVRDRYSPEDSVEADIVLEAYMGD